MDRLSDALETREAVAEQERLSPPASTPGADVTAALARLSPKLREVVVLNFYQGLRYQEVADNLGIPLGTVKSRLNLALTALRELLQNEPEL
jgi:RNA polymerase sigma-70 factor (ECF subfamily)